MTVCGDGQVAIGAKPAVQVYVTVTGVVFQPFALGAGEADAIIVGGVVLTFSVTLADALFPALSMAVPLITWLAPCATVCGFGQEAIPDNESVQLNVTVAV